MKKKQMNYKRVTRILLSLYLLLPSLSSHSQTLADTIRNEMIAINKAYDSAFFLTFDIRISYTSDTLWAGTDSADFKNSVMEGTYTFNRNKALYRLGNIEFMQNDSFAIGVYKDNKVILVGKPLPGQTPGMVIPTRTLIDSMMTALEAQYDYTLTFYDSVATMVFGAIDTNAVYKKIRIDYDSASHYLLKIEYRFADYEYEPLSGDEEDDLPTLRKADLVFEFKKYRIEQVGAAVFDETKYLFFDGPNTIVPADAYKDYTIYKNY
jgi:hypothetical protein